MSDSREKRLESELKARREQVAKLNEESSDIIQFMDDLGRENVSLRTRLEQLDRQLHDAQSYGCDKHGIYEFACTIRMCPRCESELRAKLTETERELGINKTTLRAELDAAHELREKFGAKADEDFSAFVERLATERDEAKAKLEEVCRNRDFLWEERKQLKAKLEEAERELAKAIRECQTCSGTGVMDVVIRVLPPDGEEEFETVECAECHGTGIGWIGELMDREKQVQARIEELGAELSRMRKALKGCLPPITVQYEEHYRDENFSTYVRLRVSADDWDRWRFGLASLQLKPEEGSHA